MVSDQIQQCTLGEAGEFQVRLLNYGAGICSIRVPAGGETIEAVLQYPRLADYLSDRYYLGSTVGRYAGRIRSGALQISGKPCQLAVSESTGGHSLHGGPRGFHSKYWQAESAADRRSVRFRYLSADGEEGFPGNLEVEIRYSIMPPMRLLIEYRARTDKVTVVNLSNHAYFNLHRSSSSIHGHELSLNADRFAPNDAEGLPTGEIREVNGSPFDLRQGNRFLAGFQDRDPQLRQSGGYDHYFFLNKPGNLDEPAATLYSPESGLQLSLYSTNPGLQLYSGNFLETPFKRRQALCFEFQDPPDAPNIPEFPFSILQLGECYFRQTMLNFEVV